MSDHFVTTRWTRVVEARADSDEGRAALSDLCEAYYQPVFAFVRRAAPDEDKARDLTQEFFARLLERQTLGNADPARGRFRSYLLGAARNFLRDTHDRNSAAKRNPGAPPISIHNDTNATNAGFDIADPHAAMPDAEFDRRWALAVLERALKALEQEHADDPTRFAALKPFLTGDSANVSQAGAARALGQNENTIKVAIHRLRRRFRDHVKNEIASTLPAPAPALVADEMSYLVWILQQETFGLTARP